MMTNKEKKMYNMYKGKTVLFYALLIFVIVSTIWESCHTDHTETDPLVQYHERRIDSFNIVVEDLQLEIDSLYELNPLESQVVKDKINELRDRVEDLEVEKKLEYENLEKRKNMAHQHAITDRDYVRRSLFGTDTLR